jgi:hypothetical protein
MQKLKVRLIVGWRERENQVRRIRSRMRASAAFKGAPMPALLELKKKTA